MAATKKISVGLSVLAAYLPPRTESVDELSRQGALISPPQLLKSFGFRRAHVADGLSAQHIAERTVQKLFRATSCKAEDIDVILYASAMENVPVTPLVPRNPLTLFRYPASWLQYRFRMNRAQVIGVSQAGCVSFLTAIRLATNIIRSENGVRRVLCVGSDVLPKNSKREMLYNIISDGGCAALVERGSSQNKIVAYTHVTKGYYWEPKDKQNEMIATYFPTARYVMNEALRQCRLTWDDIALIIPHNVGHRSWEILADLVGVPREKVYLNNVGRHGHTIAADTITNLADAEAKGKLKKGEYALLFTFGFGAHWACLIVRY